MNFERNKPANSGIGDESLHKKWGTVSVDLEDNVAQVTTEKPAGLAVIGRIEKQEPPKTCTLTVGDSADLGLFRKAAQESGVRIVVETSDPDRAARMMIEEMDDARRRGFRMIGEEPLSPEKETDIARNNALSAIESGGAVVSLTPRSQGEDLSEFWSVYYELKKGAPEK